MKKILLAGLASLMFVVSANAEHGRLKVNAEHNRPIVIISNQSPGGLSDLTARIYARHLGEHLKTTTVVENRVGAVGEHAVSAALVDDNNIKILVSGPLILNSSRLSELIPVMKLSDIPTYLMTNSSYTSLEDFLQKAREKELDCGINGLKGSYHMFCIQLALDKGIKVQPIPFKSSANIFIELAAGRLDFCLCNIADVPGVNMFEEVRFNIWIGAFISTHTPEFVVNLITKASNDIVNSESFIQELNKAKIMYEKSFADFASFIRDEIVLNKALSDYIDASQPR